MSVKRERTWRSNAGSRWKVRRMRANMHTTTHLMKYMPGTKTALAAITPGYHSLTSSNHDCTRAPTAGAMPSPEYRGGGGGGGGGSDKEDPELRERCAGGSFDPPARPRFDFDGIGRAQAACRFGRPVQKNKLTSVDHNVEASASSGVDITSTCSPT